MNVFKELYHLLGVRKMCTPLHPQSDRTIASFKRTLGQHLLNVVDKNLIEWDQCIPVRLQQN